MGKFNTIVKKYGKKKVLITKHLHLQNCHRWEKPTTDWGVDWDAFKEEWTSLCRVQHDDKRVKYWSRDDFVRINLCIYLLKKHAGDFKYFWQTVLGLKQMKWIAMSII